MPKKTASEPKSPNPIPISTRRRAAALFPKQDRSALLLPGEDPQKLQTLYAEYHDYFRPTSIVEVSIISQMVAATWRSHRTAATESARIVEKAEELMGEHRKTHNGEVHYDRLMAQATEALTPFLTSINRTYTTCRNMFRSALADLEKVRKLKGDPTQPFLPAPDVLECLTNLAEPQPEPKSPARIFEMPAPILDPEPDPAQQPAASGPVPEPAPVPHTPCQWFESEDYVEPAPPTAE
ncbi:MAG: hypothetical protein JNK48_30830, partial [Bryobacterales bacterium]|nr:hypothetical protein [Bryobacterales bacterium]